jgi:hypothetical protein
MAEPGAAGAGPALAGRTATAVRPVDAEIEAALRRYFGKVAARSVPVLAGLLAIALVIAFVPTSEPKTGSALGLGGSGGQSSLGPAPGSGAKGAVGAAGSGQGAIGSLGTAGSGTGGPGAAFGPTSPGATSGGGEAPSSSPSSSTQAGITPAAAPGSSGVTVTGVHCGPGVRQFSWSKYAPTCVPAWHGNNGGATAPGVTATTITLSYRVPATSAELTAAEAVVGPAVPDDAAYVSDLRSYIRYFNTQFELYGRHVVLETFEGQGDFIAEGQGEDLAGAQADAVTAHDLGAFGDVTFPFFSSQYYYQDLAAEHVIGFGAAYLPNSFFDQYAPYEYSVFSPTGTDAALAEAETICRRMAHLPASFTEPPLSLETRRFGLVIPDNPVYSHLGDLIAGRLAACGAPLARTDHYSFDVAEFESQAVSIVAQMRAAGVTTVICGCDPEMPIFLSQAADQQDYYPEWVDQYWGDAYTQNFAQDQWIHAIANGPQAIPPDQTEAFRVFQRAYPGSQPAERPPAAYFPDAYFTLLALFSALQGAGPVLTPASFEHAWFSLAPSLPGGEIGPWRFGTGRFDPYSAFTLSRWNEHATSALDGKPGAWLACDGGTWYPYADPSALGGPRVPLSCPPGT